MSDTKIYASQKYVTQYVGERQPLIYQNTIVFASQWNNSTTYQDYPYEAIVQLDGITEDYMPEVSFLQSDAVTYMFGPNAKSNNGSLTIYAMNKPSKAIVIPTILCTIGIQLSTLSLNDIPWDVISEFASSDMASAIWSVGDTKAVHVSGTVGTLPIDQTLYVYILGFNHNGSIGIDFGTFKTAESDGVDVALVDGNYGSYSSDGTKYFNVHHWGMDNYGGWAGCDLRYDVLGSTNIPPSRYGYAPSSGRTGYNASSTCATNPVANTLMAALPSELRSVMTPMIIYTDNVAGGTDVEINITATIDYLPLLAEFEIFGKRTYANSYEQNYQMQYEYYSIGNSSQKYNYANVNNAINWYERSPWFKQSYNFCYVRNYEGRPDNSTAWFSNGLAPIFRVGAMPIITFTINEKEHKATFGMTWAEWCDSKYNTLGLSVDEDGMMINDDGDVIYSDKAVYSNAFIEIDKAYGLDSPI